MTTTTTPVRKSYLMDDIAYIGTVVSESVLGRGLAEADLTNVTILDQFPGSGHLAEVSFRYVVADTRVIEYKAHREHCPCSACHDFS